MYAVIASGGKQYKVAPGDIIKVEKLDGKEGETVTFDKVLLVNSDGNLDVGTPYIDSSKVEGKVLKQERDKKIDVIKFIRRKRHTRKAGHRQPFTEVEITGIS